MVHAIPQDAHLLKKQLESGGTARPFWVVGPCVLESDEIVHEIAAHLVALKKKHSIEIVFKASFDKANRTSAHSKRGPGITEGLKRLASIRETYKLPVLTDVHETAQVEEAAKYVDILQVPAFLSRQTDLIYACARSGRAVNVKKGQFLSPENVIQIKEKLGSCAHWITERGVSFGYARLIVDFAGFHVMKNAGASLIFDATHSVQLPGAAGDRTGGIRDAIPDLARAAAAVGVSGIFAETHPSPAEAWSDAANAWPLSKLEELMLSVNQVSAASQRRDLGAQNGY